MYKILDLFSGLGGFSLGLERTGHFETVAFCDNNQYSKLILDKHWKGVKIYDDVREISKEKFKEDGIEFPDIITGGFPCQPFSVAGKQKGTSDDRHLWPEMFRIIKAFKPKFIIGENVRGLINIQDGVVFETVCTDLENEGYEVQPFIIPAAGVGAPHRRERVWIVAVRSDMANTFCDDERQEISRSDEETRGIQEEHRTEHSTTGQSSRTSAIRNGDNGYENVADTKNGRGQPSQSERWQGTERGSIDRGGIEGKRKNIERDEDMENSRRTLRQGGELQGENGNETRERNANIDQRSSGTSESNVADTHSSNQRTGKKSKQQEGNTSRKCFSNSSEYVADTESIGSNVRERREHQEERQGQQQTRGEGGETMVDSSTGRCTPQETEVQPGRYSSFDSSWWQSEPNVGRVAHGVSGRVHRLKALGNSIVPQIAEEIGKAIIQAEKE